MNRNLEQALEANQRYYARFFAKPFRLENWPEPKNIVELKIYKKAARAEIRLRALEEELGFKFNADQPRVPAGSTGGGQWTSGDGGSSSLTDTDGNDNLDDSYDPFSPDSPDAIDEIPLDKIFLAIPATEAAAAIRSAIAVWNGAEEIASKYSDIIDSIEEYFDGPPDRAFFSPDDNFVMMKDGQKIRFDIGNSHGEEPHFHFEEEGPNGKWQDVGDKHIYFFNNE